MSLLPTLSGYMMRIILQPLRPSVSMGGMAVILVAFSWSFLLQWLVTPPKLPTRSGRWLFLPTAPLEISTNRSEY